MPTSTFTSLVSQLQNMFKIFRQIPGTFGRTFGGTFYTTDVLKGKGEKCDLRDSEHGMVVGAGTFPHKHL